MEKTSFQRSLPTTGIYLDISHPNKEGLFPVKIRVVYKGKAKYFKTGMSLSKAQYESSYKAQKPRGDNYHLKEKLNKLILRSKGIIDRLEEFTFQSYTKEYFKGAYDNDDLGYHFQFKIDQLTESERYGSADAYSHTHQKLKAYFSTKRIQKPSLLDITPKSLLGFEKWMNTKGYSPTTTGIYLRSLRAIINKAIKKGDIPQSAYPFGSRQDDLYEIPITRNVKKALTIDQIKAIINIDLSDDIYRSKARDFWLLSLYCNGANLNDILRWKQSDLKDNSISFIRGKTKNTKRLVESTTVALTDKALQIISLYKGDGELVFPVLEGVVDEKDKRRLVRNYTRFVNQHMKVIAERLNIDESCSSIYARHSWSTLALNKNVGIEFISQGLSHNSIQTTRAYLKGFDKQYIADTTKKIFEDL